MICTCKISICDFTAPHTTNPNIIIRFRTCAKRLAGNISIHIPAGLIYESAHVVQSITICFFSFDLVSAFGIPRNFISIIAASIFEVLTTTSSPFPFSLRRQTVAVRSKVASYFSPCAVKCIICIFWNTRSSIRICRAVQAIARCQALIYRTLIAVFYSIAPAYMINWIVSDSIACNFISVLVVSR